MNKDSLKKVNEMCEILDFHKGNKIAYIDLSAQTVIADYFIIAHGLSAQQTKSLADYLDKDMSEKGIEPLRRDGYAEGLWIVLDYGDIIVHLFRKEEREYFDLERLWENGENVVYMGES